MIHTISQDIQSLPVMEQFYTIQGEGRFTGHAAYFIRLAGCDVGCHWCDVKDSWTISTHQYVPVSQIVAEAGKHASKLAVITGGEPLMHNLDALTQALKAEGFHTNIETSAVCDTITGQWDWLCFSPKKFKTPNKEVYALANELKVIVYNHSDFEFAEEHAALVHKDCLLYLQPEWSRQDQMAPKIVEYVKNNPKWRLSLQTHKFLDIP